MFWNRLVSLIFGGALVVSRPLPSPALTHVTLGELLSYDCGRAVTGLGAQTGPLFGEGELLFTSLTTSENKPILMIDSGSGLFAVDLGHEGVNRLRFDLPADRADGYRTYYLSYVHDEAIRSRYLEFAADRPPVGHFEFDYLTIVPRRAENLLPHLEYAILATSANTVSALNDGRLRPDQLRSATVRGCDHLARENPRLAEQLFKNLNDVAALVSLSAPRRISTRMPASVP